MLKYFAKKVPGVQLQSLIEGGNDFSITVASNIKYIVVVVVVVV